MECEFCKNKYANSYILKTHQTSKKCVLLQKQLRVDPENQDENKVNNFKCLYCEKILSSKSRLDNHYLGCKNKIKKLEETISKEKEDQEEINILNKRTERTLQSEIRVKTNIIFEKNEQIRELIKKNVDFEEKLKEVSDENKVGRKT